MAKATWKPAFPTQTPQPTSAANPVKGQSVRECCSSSDGSGIGEGQHLPGPWQALPEPWGAAGSPPVSVPTGTLTGSPEELGPCLSQTKPRVRLLQPRSQGAQPLPGADRGASAGPVRDPPTRNPAGCAHLSPTASNSVLKVEAESPALRSCSTLIPGPRGLRGPGPALPLRPPPVTPRSQHSWCHYR